MTAIRDRGAARQPGSPASRAAPAASPTGAPLQGLLVVSVEHAVAGPLCTLRLADAGARVIKIEPLSGDRAREYDDAVGGVSACFAWLNRGKQSVALDLKASDDLALARRMIARADVFVQNLAPGASARLGLGSRDLVTEHPRLIAVDVLGYGSDTPFAKKRAYDMLIQAESGICAVTGTPEVPSKVGVSVADIGTGTHAHVAVLEALLRRERTGRGEAIEVAMFDGMAEWMALPLLHYDHLQIETGRYGLSHASVYPYRPYACRDGEIVISVQSAAEWTQFCTNVLGRPDLVADPRFSSNPARVAHRDALDGIVGAVFAARSCDEMIALLDDSRIAWGRVSKLEDLAAHPALRRLPVRLPSGETFYAPRPAGHPVAGLRSVPALGADTESIRKEFAELVA